MANLKRSGRVPAVVTTLGGLLNIKPMIEMINSEVKPIGAFRTNSQGNERILDLLLKDGNWKGWPFCTPEPNRVQRNS